jgi:hypothetical protein
VEASRRRCSMLLPNQVTMLRAMLVTLMLDCLLCVYGVRVEDTGYYLNCIANPAGCTGLYAARPFPLGNVCELVTRSPSLSGWAGGGGGTQGSVERQ